MQSKCRKMQRSQSSCRKASFCFIMMGIAGQLGGKGMYSHMKAQVNKDTRNRINADTAVKKKNNEPDVVHMMN